MREFSGHFQFLDRVVNFPLLQVGEAQSQMRFNEVLIHFKRCFQILYSFIRAVGLS